MKSGLPPARAAIECTTIAGQRATGGGVGELDHLVIRHRREREVQRQRRLDRLRPVGDALVLAAVGREDEQRRLDEVTRDGLEQIEQQRCRPLQIVDPEHDRSPPRTPPEGESEAAEHRVTRGAGRQQVERRTDDRAGASRPRRRGRTRAYRPRAPSNDSQPLDHAFAATRRSASCGRDRAWPSNRRPPATTRSTRRTARTRPRAGTCRDAPAMIVVTTSSTSRDLPMPGSPVTATIALRRRPRSRRGC